MPSAEPALPDPLSEPAPTRLEGERGPPPSGALRHVLLSLTLISPLLALGRLGARHLLGWKRPLALEFSQTGLSVHQRTVLFGRTVLESRSWLPRENLAYVAREARFPRAALYVGLACLALGSFVGVSLLLDAADSAVSGTLASKGLLVIAGAFAIDFALNEAATSARMRCRVLVCPRRGAAFSCERVDASTADIALRAFAAAEPDRGAQG